ncbi:acetyl-CoA C-acetyltransferase [Thermotomaculum hydrothermale]|uniref:Acetyl-CoA C-acetyltransferase n=1 Tax=Thermotomaculum hydrothermale TaxID=981385 RepID=A0A7R6PM30_9BACT|nr:thiolase domain-containing protein [Thermotomaculum hydrothermale]BBB32602.1 acetyl-CoA C-acetyltransferase [Thermotomaculum hydrothermale]
MSVVVIGTGHTKFGKLKEKTLYDLIVDAGKEAIEDSRIEPKDIGAIFVASYDSGGFNNQGHLGPIALEIHPDLRFKPTTRLESACASGSAAILMAMNAIEAGMVDYALVIGVEKMTSLPTSGVTKVLATGSHWPTEGEKGMTFPGLFAEYAKGYMAHHGYSLDELRVSLAKISAKNHKNALENPLAQLPLDITYEDILNTPDEKNPIIAEPLRLYDCSLISDGAAAMVIARKDKAEKIKENLIEIAAMECATDYLPMSKRPNYEFTAGKVAVKKAYEKAGITVDDLDFAEVHDCFTIAELLAYEALGITKDGEGYKALEEGIVYKDGKLPVNLSGGLKAKGHPVGATGVSMGVIATRQLLGNAIGHQLKDPKIGITFNIGGSAASNYVGIYKRVK